MQQTLAAVVGFGLIGVGVAATVAPRLTATAFGLPTEEPTALAYLRAAGARDAIIGTTVLGSLEDARALRRVLAQASLIGLSDALLLAAAKRGLIPQHVFHLGGFAAVALLALFTGRDE